MQSAPHIQVQADSDLAPGQAALFQFLIVCPSYPRVPRLVRTSLSLLDAVGWNETPRVVTEEPGQWSFHQSFFLKHDGEACPEGRYQIGIEVDFPWAPAAGPGRFLRAALTFQVQGADAGRRQRIEIVADDFSIVDVGRLSHFGDVVLRAGKNSNVIADDIDPAGAVAGGRSPGAAAPGEGRVFRLDLKPNFERRAELPFVSSAVPRGLQERQTLLLRCTDGRRLLLFAKESLQAGRNPTVGNDLLLGVFPVTEENRPLTKQISREHFRLALGPGGLEALDLGSSWGTSLDGTPLEPRQPTKVQAKPGSLMLSVAKALDLRLHLYQPDPSKTAPVDEWHADALGLESIPGLWRRAAHAGLEAARIERVGNLANEEYILLFRQALVGSDRRYPVQIDGGGVDPLARLIHAAGAFWLERLGHEGPVKVAGHELNLHELAPLAPGQTLQLGNTRATVEERTIVEIEQAIEAASARMPLL